jgi:xanthine dehydrogenase accessory factor
LVAENTKGSPGTPGAKFMVSENNELFGTVGGGIMEHRIAERAMEAFKQRSFHPEIQTLHHKRTGKGEKSGMICSGSQTNVYYMCERKKDLGAIDRLISVLDNDEPGILSIDETGLTIQQEGISFGQPKIQLNRKQDNWRYREHLLNRKRLAIIGGGHCSVALCRTMKTLGYEVFIYETRKDVFTMQNVECARATHIVSDYVEAGKMIRYPELTALVVMTIDYPTDVRGLLGTIDLPFPFIGIMGTKVKIANIFRDLRKHGISQGKLDSLYAPVGLPIESDTPEEIAISVAAQILQERNVGNKFL